MEFDIINNMKGNALQQECIPGGKISATQSCFEQESVIAPPQNMYGDSLPNFQRWLWQSPYK